MERVLEGAKVIGDFLKDYLLLFMRLFWGWNFFIAGVNKLSNISMVSEYFQSLSIPLPMFNAYAVGLFESIGGACLFFGFASRIVTMPLALIMLSALVTAHHYETVGLFENPQRFVSQLPFNYLLTCLVIFCFGPGKFSIDWLFEE